MIYAENAKALAPEQFGSRVQHQSDYLATTKHIIIDTIRQ